MTAPEFGPATEDVEPTTPAGPLIHDELCFEAIRDVRWAMGIPMCFTCQVLDIARSKGAVVAAVPSPAPETGTAGKLFWSEAPCFTYVQDFMRVDSEGDVLVRFEGEWRPLEVVLNLAGALTGHVYEVRKSPAAIEALRATP